MVSMQTPYGNGRSEERTVVKNGLNQALVEKAIWVPIAMAWFESWEKYVEYEGFNKEEYRPGPLDNSKLKGTYGDELRRGMVEGQDYILLPKNVGDMLVNKYGGGPMFPRQVLRVDGSVGNGGSSLYVSLYPTRIEVYHCNRDNKLPNKDQNNFMIRYFNGNLSLDRAIKDLLTKFGVNEFTSVRCWIKEYGERVTSIMKNHTEEGVDSVRYLTTDLVEWDSDDWKLYPESTYTTGIKEMLGSNKDCVEMILETYSSSFTPKDNLWPRFMLLQKWKDYIRVGDYVDCLLTAVQEAKFNLSKSNGSNSSWYEGKIVGIEIENDKQKKIMVCVIHPRCRDEKDYVLYTFPANYDQINPLHKVTLDRNLWKEDEEVDVYVSNMSSDNGTWVIGTIKRREGQKLSVEYRKPVESSPPSANDVESIDDDALKKSRATTTVNSLNDIDDESTTSTATTEWFNLYDPRLASLNTFTTAAVVATTHRYGAGISSVTSYGYGYGYNNYSTFDRHTAGKPEIPGAVGLQNLGNTCFLNSILQCLSNTKPITDFFLRTDYKSLINYDNPLGTGGKVVKAYGQLLTDIWSGGYIKAVPREIKQIIGELHPSFSGYEQQDAQECLSFLIDAMHEDCNQIKKKPIVQKIESNGRPDALISAESWRRFLLRNDSFIIDKCFGQLRSHVTCTNCSKESITFDEYSTLSLPIPLNTKKDVEVLVQLIGSLEPIRVVLQVELTQSMKDFRPLLIQKLRDVGVLSDIDNGVTNPTVLSKDPIPTRLSNQSLHSTTTTTTTTSGDVSDDSFEIISPANTEDKGNTKRDEMGDTEESFELVNNPNSPTDASSHLSSPPSTPLPSYPTRSTSHYFHIATYSAGRNHLLSKEYNEKDSGKVAITAYGNSRFDQFIAFQLSHPVPDVSQSYNHSYNRSQESATILYQYQAVDIVFGKVSTVPGGTIPLTSTGVYTTLPSTCAGAQPISNNLISNTTSYSSYSTYSNSNRLDLQSFVYRHSFLDRSLSNRQLYDLAKDLLVPFLNSSDRGSDTEEKEIFGGSIHGMEYRLYITNHYGSHIKHLIPNTDEIFDYKEFIHETIHNNIIVAVLLPSPLSGSLSVINSSFNWTKMTQTIDMETQGKGTVSDANNVRKDSIDVYDCINKFIEREQLAETETIYCSECKQHLPPIKKMDLFSTPDILIIQLKRFQFVPGQYFIHREKINDVIHFPIEGLDLRKYVLGYPPKKLGIEREIGRCDEDQMEGDEEKNLIYDLYAVSHHMGGLGGGHYTATCKNSLNNKWYYFNDSMVNETTPESAINGTAYVLFYQRRKGAVKWGGIKPLQQGLPDEETK